MQACGVLETIKISAAGYPTRMTYPEFYDRYRILARSSEIDRADLKATAEKVVKRLVMEKVR